MKRFPLLEKWQRCYKENRFEERDLKKETESLIIVVQNQSMRANLVAEKIYKSQKDTLCRLCKKADDSIDHVLSDCNKKE